MSTTVLLVDDHELIRQGLRRAFERSADFEVVGEAGSIAEAFRKLEALTPQVVVVDVRLPDGSGLELVREVRKRRARHRDRGPDHVRRRRAAVRRPRRRRVRVHPEGRPHRRGAGRGPAGGLDPGTFTARDLAEAMKRRMTPSGPQLSPREKEVLALLADGLGVAAISRRLYISESTAKTHISKLYEKLGAANRAQAIMSALRLGLIKQDGPQPTV